MTDREFVEKLARSRHDASIDYWQDFIQQAIEHLEDGGTGALGMSNYNGHRYHDGQPLRIGPPDVSEEQEDDWAGWTKPKGASDV